jgi:CRISPR-associated endonuclease Cas1
MSKAQASHARNPRPPGPLSADDVAAAGEALADTFVRNTPNPAVCVADGWGLRVTVDGRHLVVADGMGPHRRERRYARATHGLARLVVIGATGMVSLEALRWCAGAGVGVAVLDPSDGSVLSTSGSCAVDDGRIRRAQALAPGTETGMAIARYLIRMKLRSQAEVAAADLGNRDAGRTISRLVGDLDVASSLEAIRQLEAAAANVYWHTWESVTVEFVKRDSSKVPSHWRHFEGRRSAVNPGSARNGTDPANVLLSYSYRLLEAEGRLATLALGLDPGLGILHADMRNRDGFVLDLIEACRPIADRHVAKLLSDRVFRRRDFAEDARGVLRVLPPLSHRLTEAMASYGMALAPIAEHVAQLLGDASPYDMNTPSVLTKSKHKAAARTRVASSSPAEGLGPGVAGMRPRKKTKQRPSVADVAPLPLPICRACGGAVPIEADRDRPRGRYCESCLAERRREVGASLHTASQAHADEYAARTGSRPTHTGDAKSRRQAGNAGQRAKQREWEVAHKGEEFDPQWFVSNVLPGLATISLPAIARATGMSASAAGKIRSGQRVPHARHWEALSDLSKG